MVVSQNELETLVDRGGVTFAREGRPSPFYLRIDRATSVKDGQDDRFVEVTFNPEFSEVEGYPTDVIVRWGPRTEVIGWLRALLDPMDAEICPPPKEANVISVLFGLESPDIIRQKGDDPWTFA